MMLFSMLSLYCGWWSYSENGKWNAWWMNEGDESGILPGFFNGLLMSYGEIYRVACGISTGLFNWIMVKKKKKWGYLG